MSGVQSNPGLSGPLVPTPYQAPVPAPAVPAPAPPAMAVDHVSLQQPGGAPAPNLGMLQAQIGSGDPVKAAMAIYQLEALMATHGPQVEAILLGQLGGNVPDTTALAAIDILERMKSARAVPYLDALAANGSPALKGASSRAAEQITGRGGAPAAMPVPAPPAPQAAAPGVSPSRPLTSPQAASAPPAAAPPMAAAPTSADLATLRTQLMNPATAPAAAVKLAQMPTAQALPIIRDVLRQELPPHSADMLTTILTKKVREPGVPEALVDVMNLYPGRYTKATGKAILTLMSLKDPRYMPQAVAYLKVMSTTLAPVKKAVIDMIVRDPALMAAGGTGLTAALAQTLKMRESDDAAAAASHALSKIQSKDARDALAGSSLFDSPRPELILRALWDLGKHPAPYPPEAIEMLQYHAKSKDKKIADQAKDLLKKSGIKT